MNKGAELSKRDETLTKRKSTVHPQVKNRIAAFGILKSDLFTCQICIQSTDIRNNAKERRKKNTVVFLIHVFLFAWFMNFTRLLPENAAHLKGEGTVERGEEGRMEKEREM